MNHTLRQHARAAILALGTAAALHADDTVLIFHRGDKMPPIGVAFSFADKDAEHDYKTRLKDSPKDARRGSPEGGTWPQPPACKR